MKHLDELRSEIFSNPFNVEVTKLQPNCSDDEMIKAVANLTRQTYLFDMLMRYVIDLILNFKKN
jgi:hypothetical protein